MHENSTHHISTYLDSLTSSSMSAGLLGAGRDLSNCLGAGLGSGLEAGLGSGLEADLGEGLRSGLEADLRAGFGSGLETDLSAGFGSGLEAGLRAGLALGGECFFCGGLLCTLGFKDDFTFFLGLTVTFKQTVKSRVSAETKTKFQTLKHIMILQYT